MTKFVRDLEKQFSQLRRRLVDYLDTSDFIARLSRDPRNKPSGEVIGAYKIGRKELVDAFNDVIMFLETELNGGAICDRRKSKKSSKRSRKG